MPESGTNNISSVLLLVCLFNLNWASSTWNERLLAYRVNEPKVRGSPGGRGKTASSEGIGRWEELAICLGVWSVNSEHTYGCWEVQADLLENILEDN